MVNPLRVVRLTFAVAWVAAGVVGAWLGEPWRNIDRSNLFVFLGLVAVFGAVVAWTGSVASRITAVLGGLAGVGGVVAYFLQARTATIILFITLAAAGAVAAAASARDPERA
jgi:hypothetical protein